MIKQDGSISFASELVDLIDHFVQEYQKSEGPLDSDLDRGLVITYLLSVLQCDVDVLRQCLAEDDAFGDLPPHRVLAECVDLDAEAMEARREEIHRSLQESGWLPLQGE